MARVSVYLFTPDIRKDPLRVAPILGDQRPHHIEVLCLSLCGSRIVKRKAYAKNI